MILIRMTLTWDNELQYLQISLPSSWRKWYWSTNQPLISSHSTELRWMLKRAPRIFREKVFAARIFKKILRFQKIPRPSVKMAEVLSWMEMLFSELFFVNVIVWDAALSYETLKHWKTLRLQSASTFIATEKYWKKAYPIRT